MIARRPVLGMLMAAPALLLGPRATAAARRWTVTGERVQTLDALDGVMERLMQPHGVRAGALAVARRGKLFLERAYGWAEEDYPVPQPDSPFRLASVAKIFTAALTYELAEAGALDFGQPVFPALALPGRRADNRLDDITVRHLLEHQAGWGSSDPVFRMRDVARRLGLHRAPSKHDIVRFMAGQPLQFAPGTQARYSTFGYVLLGIVAEKVGKADFIRLLNERVTGPRGLNVFVARTRKENRLPGEGFYDQPGTGLSPEFPDREVRVPLPYGGGGWLTESMDAGGGLAASAGTVARLIGHYAVSGVGLRPGQQTQARTGIMSGTSSFAISRADGLDFCLVLNTHYFGGARDPVTPAAREITRILDASARAGLPGRGE